ncbi:hypothetical protein AB834_01965 [PVC group bacterium (ex Bugula neritina AB1)]|nr:hypothetical protein AB834_01965 [PVC group bacterium (ex Bugula neritina AB1)]
MVKLFLNPVLIILFSVGLHFNLEAFEMDSVDGGKENLTYAAGDEVLSSEQKVVKKVDSTFTVESSLKPNTTTHITFLTQEQAEDIQYFSGSYKETIVFYEEDHIKIYVGLGASEKVDLEKIRCSVGQAIVKAKQLKKEEISLILPEVYFLENSEVVKAVVEAIGLSTYTFDKYKSHADGAFKNVQKVNLVHDRDHSSDISYAQKIISGTCYARDLVNDMAHIVTPAYLADRAKDLVKGKENCEVVIFDEEAIRENNMGLLQAVGQGSLYPPRLIILKYNGDPNSDDIRAVVGKGITFDSGGLHLKPTGYIEDMRIDMAGAAVTMALFKTVVDLELMVNLVCAVPAACNSIGGAAYFPGDIYQSYSGKTVQILNTDAEGRLILADALAYVCEKYAPKELIDVATLTGAVMVALGTDVAGLFSNDDVLAEDLFEVGEETHERLWRMPIYPQHTQAMMGEFADLNNIARGGAAGSITAAAFLQEFVEETSWAHLDIAGVAYRKTPMTGYVPKNATGFGVRLLLKWLERKSCCSGV